MKSRYINIDKVLNELCLSHKDIIYIDKNETAERIRKIPSIDIVRCKECKWYRIGEYSGIYVCHRGLWDVTGNSFCSYGERREP